MPSAPLCDSIATLPAGGQCGAKVALSDTAGSVFRTPRQFGPTMRMPAARARIAAAVAAAARPVRRGLGEAGRDHDHAAHAGAAQSATTSSTCAAGTAITARSTGCADGADARVCAQPVDLGRVRVDRVDRPAKAAPPSGSSSSAAPIEPRRARAPTTATARGSRNTPHALGRGVRSRAHGSPPATASVSLGRERDVEDAGVDVRADARSRCSAKTSSMLIVLAEHVRLELGDPTRARDRARDARAVRADAAPLMLVERRRTPPRRVRARFASVQEKYRPTPMMRSRAVAPQRRHQAHGRTKSSSVKWRSSASVSRFLTPKKRK